jgi:hypothetical protein
MAATDFSIGEYSYDDVNGNVTGNITDFNLTSFALQNEDLNYKVYVIVFLTPIILPIQILKNFSNTKIKNNPIMLHFAPNAKAIIYKKKHEEGGCLVADWLTCSILTFACTFFIFCAPSGMLNFSCQLNSAIPTS